MSTYLLQVDPGEEVMEKLRELVKLSPVSHGCLTLIGAVHECTVSVMRKDDAQHDLLRSYDQPFELTGTGEVVDGEVHVHVTLAGEDLIAAGHLHRAMVRDFFVRAYLTDLDD
ncbi:PCC domain-containing protein [Actinoplanes sp. NPDC049316]|uniref:PCC domain-containing protein n=1 Tax=Actinoplanes sp. NPDC049316 TaxID=3154727 RepID=UPI0034387E6B